MPFDYAKNDARRRLKVTLRDPISREEALVIVERQAAENAWAYGLLYDARLIESRPPVADAEAVLQRVRALTERHGPRGPVALVARAAGIISTASIYAVRAAQTHLEVQVFWDIDEAERWLDRQGG